MLRTAFGDFDLRRDDVRDVHLPEDPERPLVFRLRNGDRISGFLDEERFRIDVDGQRPRDLGRESVTRIILAGVEDAEPIAGQGHRVTLQNGDRFHGDLLPQPAVVRDRGQSVSVELASLSQVVFGQPRSRQSDAGILVVSRGDLPPLIANHKLQAVALRMPSGRELAFDVAEIAAIENMADGQAVLWEQTVFRDRLSDGSDCTDCPQMRIIAPGSFAMGARESEEINRPHEGPVHTVSISYPFALGVYEVTFDQWDACRADGACRHRGADERFGRGSRPAISLNLKDAMEFLAWVSQKTGVTYRLPSEAEWELAARAGTTTTYYWGDKLGRGNAVCEKCRTKWDNKKTAPTGSFPPNPNGLYDILGNAWEWTADCWSEGYQAAPVDGSASRSGDCRGHVMRGGAWFSFPENIRSATRFRSVVGNRYLSKGLRVVRDF